MSFRNPMHPRGEIGQIVSEGALDCLRGGISALAEAFDGEPASVYTGAQVARILREAGVRVEDAIRAEDGLPPRHEGGRPE